LKTTAIIPCHNGARGLPSCVASLQGVDQIIVVDDGSTEALAMAEGLDVELLRTEIRVGKAEAVNVGLGAATGDVIIVLDDDTVLEPGALDKVLAGFQEPRVGAVGFDLRVRNEDATLTTRFQVIEYGISIGIGRQITDALDIMPLVSGAAGAFRATALQQVGGFDMEVAEDAAVCMKLREHGWRLRHAAGAIARTFVPEEIPDLIIQRLRWDASTITIWWRKFGNNLNPFARNFSGLSLLTSLDVIIFSVIMPLILPVYLWWLYTKIGAAMWIILGTVAIGLLALDIINFLLSRVPRRLMIYLPFFVIVQYFVAKPVRVIAVLGELIFSITHYDDYVPRHQRGRLT
jgi:cellulose synthase/poly-beta-1,6-N-acetylglucosamine synthase-like glycosyltransferase